MHENHSESNCIGDIVNILIIGTGIPNEPGKIGGAGSVALKVAERLASNENVFVLPWLSDRPTLLKKELDVNGVKYVRRRITPRLILLIMKHLLLGSFRSVLQYTHGVKKVKYSLLYVLERAHIERILNRLSIDVIHIHGHVLAQLPYFEEAIEREIPLVCTSHGLYSYNPDIDIDFERGFEKDILRRLSRARHAAIVAVSSEVRDRCVELHEIPKEQIVVIVNGVDQEMFNRPGQSKIGLRRKHSIPAEKAVLLQVGSLNKRKNHMILLELIAGMANSRRERLLYLIVGEGDEGEALMEFTKEKSIEDQVVFKGYVSLPDLIEMYSLSDFFILPSTSEGLPLVFLEAMSSGLPVITFKDLEGVKDIFDPECMELIQDRSHHEIMDAIERALSREWDRGLIKEYAKLWSWDDITEAYCSLYKELIRICREGGETRC